MTSSDRHADCPNELSAAQTLDREHLSYHVDIELNLTILYEKDEEGWWVAEIPEIPGACSQGRTIEEARLMVLDAARELTNARREKALRDNPTTQTETLKLAG